MRPSRNDNARLESAHKRASRHRDEVLASELCGCFCCGDTFQPAEIVEWIHECDGVGATAICPRYGIDSVIGSRSGIPLTPEFLRDMKDYWLG